jgi:hypothetical protein
LAVAPSSQTALDGGCLLVRPDFGLRNFSTHPEGDMKRLLALSLIAIAMIGTARALPGELSLWVDGANGDDLNDCTELLLLSQKVAGKENHLFGKIHTSALGGWKWVCQDRMTVKRDFRPMWKGSRA